MACEVRSLVYINNFTKVQEYFGLSHDENWLNSLTYSISPTGELIALAMGEKLAFLSTVWDHKAQISSYTLNWCGELEDPNQIVTSVLCMPLHGKGVSSGPEWTCVAIGLSSGMVLFYTDAGIKIYSESFHEEQVLSIKAYSPPRHSVADFFVYIVYDECVCIIKGAEIFPLLNTMRYNVHRALGRSRMKNAIESADILHYSKFKFARDHDSRSMIINDAVVAGSQAACTYNHVVEQCLVAGIYARVSEKPMQSSLVVGVGAEPYLGLYFAEEGYKTISLSEVAKDVIGIAYKNLLGNLFGRSQEQQPPEQQPSPSKESNMRTRCRFYDGKRDGFHIILSPNGRLAAVTDNLDRVLIVDTQRSVVLRIFKGYRDAQCAFIVSKEKQLKSSSQSHRKKALFLVIYAPRLGCLEIWALQNGSKIAAFTVSKSAQLVYNTHGLLGVGTSSKAKIRSCFFLDPSDGCVKDIQVPFHFALMETNLKTSSISRDVHMLKNLKSLLRDIDSSVTLDNISQVAAEFKNTEVKLQCLEMLRKNRQLKPEVFQVIVRAFSENVNLSSDGNEAQPNEDINHNMHIIENLKLLTDFYIAMQSPPKADFTEHLEISDNDLVSINQLILLRSRRKDAIATSSNAGRVTFQGKCKDDGDFVDYLSIFELDNAEKISLLRSKSEMFGYISSKLFGKFFKFGLNFEYFKTKASEAHIPCEDLLVLALHYWLDKTFDYDNCEEVIEDMSYLAAMISVISDLAGEHVSSYSYNAISSWWQDVREILLDSPKSSGLLVAIVCKTVALKLWRSQRDDSCDEASQTEGGAIEQWERISHEEAQWGLLIGKLDDISILGAVVEYPTLSLEPVMPEVPFDPPDCSLKLIVTGGRGIVCDLTTQWLMNSRLHPRLIVENEDANEVVSDETENQKDGADDSVTKDTNEEIRRTLQNDVQSDEDPVVKKLELLRKHFPFSLESGMLLSQMSWQYMVHWSKNLQSLDHMRAAITCLAQFKETDLALKHGMCCLLWNATLKFPLQSTMKLIQKVGRLPVDKMCQQDIEMSSTFVPEFLELAIEFLKHFSSSMYHEKRELRFEEILIEGQLPIQFIALQQHHAMKELLQLHQELCTVLHFITFFQLKFPKPVTTVFDALSNKALLADINKELPFVLPAPDLVLQQLRREFLFKVIRASMDMIREDMEDLYVAEHTEYMEKIYYLAESWKLSLIPLQQHQIIQMYAHGHDSYGEKLLKKLEDVEDLGVPLLVIAGQRMNLYTATSRTAYLLIASVGQQLLQFLDELTEIYSENAFNHSENATSLNRDIQISATEPEDIQIIPLRKLVINAVDCLSKSDVSSSATLSRHLHIGSQMYDACSILLNEMH